VVNCSIPVQLIEQLPKPAVVINCPPLGGALIAATCINHASAGMQE
jgi:hypothetical protein